MILGVGIDLVDVGRFRRAVARQEGLTEALLTPVEVKACQGLRDPHAAMAACFAAREALLKALGTGLVGSMSWHDVEVVQDPDGDAAPRPRYSLKMRGAVRDAADALAVRRTHLALTTTAGVAAAVVVLEGEPGIERQPEDARSSIP